MKWTHQPTWKDSKQSQNDRTVFFNGNPVARVIYRDFGASKGQWFWIGRWGGPHHQGQEKNLESALNTVRDEYKRLKVEDPTRLESL